jgi:hypothetical protein
MSNMVLFGSADELNVNLNSVFPSLSLSQCACSAAGRGGGGRPRPHPPQQPNDGWTKQLWSGRAADERQLVLEFATHNFFELEIVAPTNPRF